MTFPPILMATKIRALSVHQPYANWIASGHKWLEVRSWATKHRGLVLICASARPKIDSYLNSAALGIVDLHDVRPMTFRDDIGAYHPYSPKSMVWIFRHAMMIEPFHVIGKQRLFEVDLGRPIHELIYPHD